MSAILLTPHGGLAIGTTALPRQAPHRPTACIPLPQWARRLVLQGLALAEPPQVSEVPGESPPPAITTFAPWVEDHRKRI